MKLTTIGTVIAERTLDLGSGERVVVKIGKPRKFRGGGGYFCPYQIRWPNRSRISYCGGVDPVQALHLGLQMIGTSLYTSEYAKAGKLTWLGMRNLGFPVPANAEDLIPKEKPRKSVKRTARRSTSRKKPTRG